MSNNIIDKIQLSGVTYDIGGGGGKAVSGGTNISVTTGETADTINCTLRAANTSGTGSMKLAFFSKTDATGVYSVATGYDCKANGHYSFASGRGNNTNNYGECAVGFNNKTVGNSTSISKSSGCTLFSVGNGQGTNAADLHNAFEVRQNGDIYITLNDQDVKLQDQLGGGGSSYTAGDGIDITNDVISVTGKQDTLISGTNIKTVNNESILGSGNITIQGGGSSVVELTQAQYDALQTIDPDTIYVITDAQGGDLSQYMTSAQTVNAISTAVASKVDTSAITTTITSSSTNSQVPSAKAVYDIVGNIETLLSQI